MEQLGLQRVIRAAGDADEHDELDFAGDNDDERLEAVLESLPPEKAAALLARKQQIAGEAQRERHKRFVAEHKPERSQDSPSVIPVEQSDQVPAEWQPVEATDPEMIALVEAQEADESRPARSKQPTVAEPDNDALRTREWSQPRLPSTYAAPIYPGQKSSNAQRAMFELEQIMGMTAPEIRALSTNGRPRNGQREARQRLDKALVRLLSRYSREALARIRQ